MAGTSHHSIVQIGDNQFSNITSQTQTRWTKAAQHSSDHYGETGGKVDTNLINRILHQDFFHQTGWSLQFYNKRRLASIIYNNCYSNKRILNIFGRLITKEQEDEEICKEK